VQEGGGDELDELTPDELKSLLDNFQTLSKQVHGSTCLFIYTFSKSLIADILIFSFLWPLGKVFTLLVEQ
jgi:hypothetical protein